MAHDFPVESLVCYTFAKVPGAGDGSYDVKVRSIPGSFDAKDGRPHLWMGVLSIKDGPALRANAAAGP